MLLNNHWAARISVSKAEVAEALAIMTMNLCSFLLKGPFIRCVDKPNQKAEPQVHARFKKQNSLQQ